MDHSRNEHSREPSVAGNVLWHGVCIYTLFEVTSHEIVPWLSEVIAEGRENMITKLLSFSAIILALLTTNAPSTSDDGSHDDHALKCARLSVQKNV